MIPKYLPSLDPKDVSAFQGEFQGLDTPPISLAYFPPSQLGKQLTGRNLEVCLALNFYARNSSPLPDSDEEGCQALNSFGIAEGVTAYQTVTPRGHDDLEQEKVSRTLLLFKGTEFIDGIVVSDYQRLNDRESSMSSFIQDPDKDGSLDILRYTHHRTVHAAGRPDTYENVATIITLDDLPKSGQGKSQLSQINIPLDDPRVKRIVGLHRWNVFDEPLLPDYIEESGSRYQIRLFNGNRVTLSNLEDIGDGTVTYRYQFSPLEPEKVLFLVGYWGSGGALWIDRRSGEVRTLPSEPIFSPAGTRFVLSSNYYDEWNAHDGCLFEIWSIMHQYHRRELTWKCSENEFFTEYPVWSSSTSLTLKVANYNEKGMGPDRTVTLSYEAFDWKKTER